MRLGDPILPTGPESEYDKALNRLLYDYFRRLTQKVNGLAAGDFQPLDRIGTAAPTTGTYSQNDKVFNSNQTELGVVTAKYVILGWVCIASGTPGTWREMRTLTGN
jgi:hypothetical protein